MHVLVGAGGAADRDALAALRFSDVTITNIEDRALDDYEPYRWEHQNLEDLAYADDAFDWSIVSAGLHHCRSPHRALTELYRVSRRGVLALESRDSVLMRVATRIGIAEEYERTAVAAAHQRGGGVNNTAVPNYVFRWTEREVQKTIAAYAPHARHRFLWFHEVEFPMLGSERRPQTMAARALRSSQWLARVVATVFPTQANQFAFVVLKPALPADLQPWLRDGDTGRP